MWQQANCHVLSKHTAPDVYERHVDEEEDVWWHSRLYADNQYDSPIGRQGWPRPPATAPDGAHMKDGFKENIQRWPVITNAS
jgi:hypothetical protein